MGENPTQFCRLTSNRVAGTYTRPLSRTAYSRSPGNPCPELRTYWFCSAGNATADMIVRQAANTQLIFLDPICQSCNPIKYNSLSYGTHVKLVVHAPTYMSVHVLFILYITIYIYSYTYTYMYIYIQQQQVYNIYIRLPQFVIRYSTALHYYICRYTCTCVCYTT